MAAPKEILELVERFDRNREAYRSSQYNETQLRREFLDPFFEALGWDVNNKQGYAEAYKDVIHEDAIKIGGYTKAPDYCFRIGGTRKFFVEAKKPAVDIKDDISPAYQLRRYAWSAKLPLSILTDFEEFAVYDCRVKPALNDKASAARTIYVPYAEYSQRWDEIASIFSHDAVLKGSFDKYVESSKLKRGTAEVDDAFLREIEYWRDLLARHLALRNPELTQRELNFAVQQTIDRIIFLRICEDRGIEGYGQLMALQNGSQVYERLCQIFQQADARYNSGLFHFRQEKGRKEPPDELTLRLAVDDKPLKDIVKNIYYPDSPYEFSVLPADILGQVYEQFLGKVIRLTAGHRAVVEDKPEVKKAGGVYYTPTYIVDYIVRNTVGRLLENKTPEQVSELKILDPACGSGSFLISAYQFLLDWHRDWYVRNNPKKRATGRSPALYQALGGDWRLTTPERKRILLNNIYGVDIDPQAVEVTKLSLLLKVLEGESEQTLNRQLALLRERALPDLGNNIKCGNSLIGSDFYDNRQMNFLDEEERYRVNVFNWKAEFPEAFGGKARFLWFVTFVTHNSRISERMVTYGVKSGKPLVFSPDDQILIAEKMTEACRNYRISVVACNVLPDHVHMVLAADTEEDLGEQIRKIKGYTSHAFQEIRGMKTGGKVWAQKFNRKPITDEASLHDILEYVENNHLKHAEQWGDKLLLDKGLKPLVSKVINAMCVSVEEACQPDGGFDVVLGNPPYIRIQMMKEWAPLEVEYYKERYAAASKGNYDIYVVFVEKGLGLLNSKGRLGFILPHKFFNSQYGETLRELVAKGKHLAEVVHFGDHQVFAGATTYTCLLFLDKAGSEQCRFVKVDDLEEWREINRARGLITGETRGWIEERARGLSPLSNRIIEGAIPAASVTASEWNFTVGKGAALFDKLSKMPVKLGDVAERIFQGLVTGADPVFILSNVGTRRYFSEARQQDYELENDLMHPLCKGSVNIRRYHVTELTKSILFPYQLAGDKAILLSPEELEREYPLAWEYLLANRSTLESRERGKWKHERWYAFGRSQNLSEMEQTKLLTPSIASSASFTLDLKESYYFVGSGGGGGGGYGITLKRDIGVAYQYLLGLLNSRLLDKYLKSFSSRFSGGYYAYNRQYIEQLPIRTVNFSEPADKARHDRMVALVEQMLSLHKQLAAAKADHDKAVLQRQIHATDVQIDRLVYELYGLTEDEVGVVEEYRQGAE